MSTEALGDVTVSSLRLDGTAMNTEVIEAITAADIVRPIDAAPTLTLKIEDPKRVILNSGIFSSRVTAQVDRFSYELVQVKKSGDELQITFEDLVVARLRARRDPRKVGAGTMTRPEFIRLLASEEPWINTTIAPYPAERTKTEVARGTPDKPPTTKRVASTGLAADPEDTWTAAGRLLNEIGWRKFVRNPNELVIAPDVYLISLDPIATIQEVTGGVDFIDFDWDIGKPIASASVACRATRWDIPPGAVISVLGLGPATNKWLVSNIQRSLLSSLAKITLIQPEPTFPEPDAPTVDVTQVDLGAGEGAVAPADTPSAADVGRKVDTGAVSPGYGFGWPLRGTITAGFGERRPGHLHEGIDIAVRVGTEVGASKPGTVSFAGQMSGYGNVVIIQHAEIANISPQKRTGIERPGTPVETRYGHLTRMVVTKGQQVEAFDIIGYSGGAPGAEGSGDSTGPHLHFEIRVGGNAVDPMPYLTGAGTVVTSAVRTLL